MTRTAADFITSAQAAFEAGFASKAAQKRALEDLNRAFDRTRNALTDAILKARTPETEEQNHADYWGIPYDLHQVRDRHFEIAARYTEDFGIVRDMIALRAAIKAAPLAPAPVKSEIEVKAETVRRSIVEEMERRKAMFVEGLEIGRIFAALYPRKNKDGTDAGPAASLPVSVNAHMVWGHKGAVFPRHFFYLRGKLTPLNTILAIADQLEREAAEA